MSPDRIMAEWQKLLLSKGYDLGPDGADGYGGQRTKEAILLFQKAMKLTETGQFDEETRAALTTKTKINLSVFLPLILEYMTKGNISMNKDQFINLVQTLVNIGSGLAVGVGILDANTWVAVGAAIVAVATYVYTHFWNKTA